MLTQFGKFCRKIRIDNDELLKDMAKKLGVTSAYLSAIENGKREIPSSWETLIIDKYNLSKSDSHQFKKAIYESKKQIKIQLQNLKSQDKDLVVSFARKFEGLSQEKKDAIKKLLNR
ncbi:helix-turn-helix domain-containing protein [Clostridium tyrobutyricum]|uniref:helix-turn-helix domain-containing protein n=1 Tax=Clostridium tyrobutyricum TaxID=1519 RepID=UPI001C390AB5|nr:helix-turn-helix transcriptional regulator [Clostridium tyrobutyricum]MBV4427203.1 helix-turn-helix domain-containing protein [Clostridium tyrobutyricum]MBV4442462.1 helix-turn-helix domain-containing protein [Clostridium tyrobutyricum]